jgi:predicted acetyltransferase
MPSRSADWWRLKTLSDPEWSRDGGGLKMYVVVDLDGRPAAYAMYRHHMRFDHGNATGRVQVVEAMGDSPAATDAIWRHLVGVDWVERLTCDLLPVDHELQLLVLENRRLEYRIGDGLWIRIVDVAAALSARSYAGDGEVVLQLRDPFCAWNEGRWRVGGAGCERTDAEADVVLSADALGSVYLGGFAFADLVRARLAEELRPGGIARADTLFATTVKPWSPEIF